MEPKTLSPSEGRNRTSLTIFDSEIKTMEFIKRRKSQEYDDVVKSELKAHVIRRVKA